MAKLTPLKQDERRVTTTFCLHPNGQSHRLEGLSIRGLLARRTGTLEVTFNFQGSLDRIRWPPVLSGCSRRGGLWQHTCCELFFSPKGRDHYWELNVSPCGGWNIYRFSGYRSGMQEEGEVSRPSCVVFKDDVSGLFTLSCSFETGSIIDDAVGLELGVSCVVEEENGRLGYWAMSHPGAKPDFHDRKSFTALLGSIDPIFSGTPDSDVQA